MEDKFLASMMRSTEVGLLEKIKLYKTHHDKLDPYGAKTPSETKQALLEEVKNYDFSKHGTTKQIIRFCREAYRAYEFFSHHVVTAAKQFIKLETLSLKEACEEMKDWNFCVVKLSYDICQSIDWAKLKKEKVIKAARETDTETLWVHLINTQVLTEEDLDMLIWGQKVETPKIIPYSMDLGGFSIRSHRFEPSKSYIGSIYTLEKAIYNSQVKIAYKKKMLLWETNRESIGEAVKNIFWTNKDITEKDILEIALKYGNCEIRGLCQENIYELALSRFKKPANMLKIARLLKGKNSWEIVIEKMELRKQDAKKILRIAKISGYPPIWEMFFYANKQLNAAVSHEELMRIGEKSKNLALWAVLLKHVDYSKISIEWVFKFIKHCAVEVPHHRERCSREYQTKDACNCMEAISSRFNWKSVSYEKRIEALSLHWYCDWQNPIIDAFEKIEVKDFLALNEKFRGVSDKLQSKVLTEA